MQHFEVEPRIRCERWGPYLLLAINDIWMNSIQAAIFKTGSVHFAFDASLYTGMYSKQYKLFIRNYNTIQPV